MIAKSLPSALLVLALSATASAQCLAGEFRADHPSLATRFASDFCVLGEELVVAGYGERPDRSPDAAIYVMGRERANWYVRERLPLQEVTNGVRRGLQVAAGPAGIAAAASFHVLDRVGLFLFEELPDGTWEPTRLWNDENRSSYPAGIAVGEDFVAVGFPRDDRFGHDAGSVQLFTKAGEEWSVTEELSTGAGGSSQHLGQELAYAEGILAVSATGDDGLADGAGAVWLFRKGERGRWKRLARLTASDGREHDFFGASIGFDGRTLAIGATGVDYGRWDNGAVYVFEELEGEWREVQRLAVDPPREGRRLGRSIAVQGHRMLVGSGEREPSPVRLFLRTPGGSWVPDGEISLDPDTVGEPDWRQDVGATLALEDGRAYLSSSLSHFGFQRLGSGLEFSLDEDACGGLEPGSLLSTGTAEFRIDRGPESAGKAYLLLGTYSGTTPGLSLGTGRLPLNYDFYFEATLTNPTQGLLRGSFGVLDDAGRAQIELAVPSRYVAPLDDVQLNHAFLELEGGQVTYISNSVTTWMWPRGAR